jgi:ABC-2 type transport system permease protein
VSAAAPTYVFEGMRALLINHVFRTDQMIEALLINAVLFIASFAIFLALPRSARRYGSLIQGGEESRFGPAFVRFYRR